MADNIRLYTDGEQATAEVLNRPLGDLEKIGQYMSKAEYEAIRKTRKEIFEGNGYIFLSKTEWGGDVFDIGPNGIERGNLDQGLAVMSYTGPAYNADKQALQDDFGDKVIIDWYNQYTTGGFDEHSNYFHSDGEIQRIIGHTTPDKIGSTGKIPLPEAPDLKGTITDLSSFDFDLNVGEFAYVNDLNHEFLDNPSFDTGVGHWYARGGYGTLSYDSDNKKAVITHKDGDQQDNRGILETTHIYMAPNAEYIVKVKTESVVDRLYFRLYNDTSIYSYSNIQPQRMFEKDGYSCYIFNTSDFRGVGRLLVSCLYDDNGVCTFDEVSIKLNKETIISPLTRIVAGSNANLNRTKYIFNKDVTRKDFVFIEKWHELISERDVVFPYGNVQYNSKDINKVHKLKTADWYDDYDTYSLHGFWQDAGTIVPKGYRWSELTQDEQLMLAQDPYNNIYNSEDGLVQVRYRIRVIRSKGQKSPYMENVSIGSLTSWSVHQEEYDVIKPLGRRSSYSSYAYVNGDFIYWSSRSNSGYFNRGSSYVNSSAYTYGSSYSSKPNTYTALPLFEVQRLNKGAYHPSYNPNGCATFSDGNKWYDTTDSANNIVDCFNNKANGNVASEISGRVDRLFYNLIDYRNIKDMRTSSHKITDIDQYLQNVFADYLSNKLIGYEDANHGALYTITVGRKIIGGNYDIFFNSDDVQYGTLLSVMNTRTGKILNEDMTGSLSNDSYNSNYNHYFNFYRRGTEWFYNDIRVGDKMILKVRKHNNDVEYAYRKPVIDIIGDPRKLSDRVDYTVTDGESQVVDIIKGDYVLNDDGVYYAAVRSREGIDLDTDDYTVDDYWVNMGTDGTIGGYPSHFYDGENNYMPNIGDEMTPKKYPADINEYGAEAVGYIRLNKSIINRSGGNHFAVSKVIAHYQDGTHKELSYHASWDTARTGEPIYWGYSKNNAIAYNPGTTDKKEILNCVLEVHYDTYTNGVTITGEPDILCAGDIFANTGYGYNGRNEDRVIRDLINIAPMGYGPNSIKYEKPTSIDYIDYKLSSTVGREVTHDEIDLNITSSNRSSRSGDLMEQTGVKVLPMLRKTTSSKETDNIVRHSMILFYKQLKAIKDENDNIIFGDNNKFAVTDHVYYIDDDNGNRILNGFKEIRLRHFFKNDRNK